MESSDEVQAVASQERIERIECVENFREFSKHQFDAACVQALRGVLRRGRGVPRVALCETFL